jgi:hypothetical protein
MSCMSSTSQIQALEVRAATPSHTFGFEPEGVGDLSRAAIDGGNTGVDTSG